jgi:hypothetical protein
VGTQQKPITSSLTKFAEDLPLTKTPTSAYSLIELVDDLINHAKSHITSNVVVVPVLQAFTVLLEADVLRHLPDVPAGLQRSVLSMVCTLQNTHICVPSIRTLLAMTSRNVDKLKSVQRILESMKMWVSVSVLCNTVNDLNRSVASPPSLSLNRLGLTVYLF